MVVLVGAEFQMGSEESEPGHENGEKRHRRRIPRRFAIGATEVTREQFTAFQLERPAEVATLETGRYVKTDDSPQVAMTWYEAVAYCNWLSDQEGLPVEQRCYDSNADGKYAAGMKLKENYLDLVGYRLPTQAEWEFACRSGTTTSRHYGMTETLLPQYAWYQVKSEMRTWPVGSLKPNDVGLFDMLGNVAEWCNDEWEEKPADTHVDSPVGTVLTDVVSLGLRGGSFNFNQFNVRSAYRSGNEPLTRYDNYGFRVARTYP
jgi:hypothetical protein